MVFISAHEGSIHFNACHIPPTQAEQREFVKLIIASKAGKIPEAALTTAKRLERKQQDQTEGEWMTFKAASDRDGETLIRECIAHGTMATRPNQKLPPTSKVPWPFNQEVAYVREGWSTATSSRIVRGCDEVSGRRLNGMFEICVEDGEHMLERCVNIC